MRGTEEIEMTSKERGARTCMGDYDFGAGDEIIGHSQILVKTAACGLCNWELNHWKGILGKCPMPLGHEVGGRVEKTGEGVTGFEKGDPVTDKTKPYEISKIQQQP